MSNVSPRECNQNESPNNLAWLLFAVAYTPGKMRNANDLAWTGFEDQTGLQNAYLYLPNATTGNQEVLLHKSPKKNP